MQSVRKRLSDEGLLQQLFSDATVDALLTAMHIDHSHAVSPTREQGQIVLGVVEHALGVLDLNLVPPGPNAPRAFVLSFEGGPGARLGFRLAVSLTEGPAQPLFGFLEKLPGQGLRAAERKTGNDREWLEAIPGEVRLAGAGVWLVLSGRAGGSISLRLSPRSEAPDDVITLQLQPTTVLVGQSGFGLELPQGLVLDLAEDAAPAAGARVNGQPLATPADIPAWRGLALNAARLYLPRGVPFLGEHAVDAVLQVGLPPVSGAALVLHTKVPAQGKRPEIDVRIECVDPTATGLDGLVPTLVEAVMSLPLEDNEQNFGQPLKLGGGKPVRARARWARTPAAAGQAAGSTLSLALESQGADGLVKIDSTSGGLGAKIAVTAATLASALLADGAKTEPAPDGDGTTVVLHTLLVAAMGLSAFLEAGQLVLHRAELLSSGGAVPLGKTIRLKIDYSVAAQIMGLDIGALSVKMKPNQPLRVRVREVVLSIDPEASGLKMFHLDYARSSMEVEDPGGWLVHGPGDLFDVLGTRSGRGSMWIEVDLRFKLDLGPVKVSGATIRATLDAQGRLSGSLRGLEAAVGLPGVIGGQGGVRLTEAGFYAALAVTVDPLGIGAEASVETAGRMVKLVLGVDLPGPLPLGNSGLAIYGLGGLFAANGKPKPVPPGADPITTLLDWDYRAAGSFVEADAFSFGLEAVLGTAADLGFTFSARTGIVITVPDLAVRGAVEGRFMGPRMKIVRGDNGFGALQAKGLVVLDPAEGVTVALKGSYVIPQVLEVTVPVGAHFPRKSAAWFIHLGADGWRPPPGQPSEGREMGPVRAVLLPGLVDQSVDAYLMFRGDGITRWPRGGPRNVAKGTFMLACGFGFEVVYGLKPVVWAEVGARADILVSTNPMSFTGLGQIHGSLNVTVFSVGVEAGLTVILVDGAPPYMRADICGVIDLFFDEIRKCVTVHVNSPPPLDMPVPAAHPLDREGGHSLVDDRYRKIGSLAGDRAGALAADAVWPDARPLFAFSSAPTLALAAGQFPDASAYPEGLRARPLGSDLLSYEWHLLDVKLIDATEADTPVAGTFSCSWLEGKGGDAANQPQPAELVLLTPNGDLWLYAQADLDAAAADGPLAARAGICRLAPSAQPGWALGEAAAAQGDAWSLPASPTSVDPLASQVRARVSLWTGTAAARRIDAAMVQGLPGAYAYTRPQVRPMPLAEVHGHAFNGWFDPGALLLPPAGRERPERLRTTVDLVIELDDALTRVELWLVLPGELWRDGITPGNAWVQVFDDANQAWQPGTAAGDVLDAGDGWAAVCWRPTGGVPVKRVVARLWLGLRAGVLGVWGFTSTALAAAQLRKDAADKEAAKQAAAKAAGPAKGGAAPTPTSRCVLQPGRVYRIDITMAWSGTLWQVDDKGVKTVLAQRAVDASTTSTRSYWYRTAPLQNPAARGAIWREGTATHFALMHRRQDLFDPVMLERLLRCYEPAQSELHRFANDRLRALFAPSHADVLAGAYGFKLQLAVRRLDQPAAVEGNRVLKPSMTWAEPAFLARPGGVGLTLAEAMIASAYVASPCGLAPDAAQMSAAVKLTRDAWYEVFVLAKSQNKNVADGRLRGASFRTSRWANASEMLAGLGFPTSGVGQALGGVALAPDAVLAPQVLAGNDALFEQALQALGVDGWPAASDPRVSLLWREQAGAWLCAGVFIESPEPLQRPGRLELQQLRLSMGSTTRSFDVRLSDRAGHRVLWATSAPFLPRKTRPRAGRPLQNPQLVLVCRDLPPGAAARTLSGRIDVPLAPSFAEEALA